jgi:ribosomal protein S18 acetylase RimI-like enzyme
MNDKPFTPGPSGHMLVVTRVADGQWHVLDDDLVAGRGHAVRRPDGRLFVSIDAWHDAAFDRLAEVMLADLPAPLYTVVDEADLESTIVDSSRYTVAAAPDRYLGLVRLATATRQPRIGLIAVRAGERRRGIARALLSQVLGALHAAGIATVSAEVDESNTAALALFEGIAGRRTGSSLELVR